MRKFRPRTSLAGLRPPIRHFAAHGPAEAQLFVRNLPSGAEADDVRGAFEAVCTVLGVRVPLDNATGQSRGFAFVTIEAAECDVVRREMDGALLGGRKIAAQLATASSKAPAHSSSRSQRSGGKAAAIALNKQLISSETAADVLSLFENKGGDFNYVNFATALHRLGVLSRSFHTSSRPLLHKLVERAVSSIRNESNQWESRELASASWGIAKIGNVEAPALFEAVAGEATKKIAAFNSLSLANIVWAYATAEVEAPALFKAVAAEASKKIATFNSQNLANTVWAYATARVEAPALFEAVAAEAPKKIATFNSQELANTAWAYAAAGVEAPALFEAVAREAPKKIATFNSQNLANTVWAFSTAGVAAPALFKAVATEAPSKIATFLPQNLANTVWAYATAGVEAPALFEAVAAEAPKNIATFHSQALANTAWAYATAGVAAPRLFNAVAAEASKKIATFTAQALANTVWAYATAGVEAPTLFEAIAGESSKKIAAFNSQSLANTVWAYATAGVAAPALFEVIAAEASKKIATFDSQALANTVWAYATAGVEAPALFEAVAAEAPKKIASFNTQNLPNTVWAYATAGVVAPALFEAFALRIKAKISEFSPGALSQLHQVYVHLRLEAPQHALTLMLSRHEADIRAAYGRQEPSPSRTQHDVSAALSSIGWAHEFEHVTAEGISLDMAQPESKVAVEFDGPKHYLVGSSDGVSTRVLDGTSNFKERLLRRLGWKLVRVPYFEWDVLQSGAEREAYLRDGMAAALSPNRDAAVQSADGGDAPATKGEAASRECGEAAYSRMTVKDLKGLLKERGLKQAGLKRELVQRFEEDDERRRNAV